MVIFIIFKRFVKIITLLLLLEKPGLILASLDGLISPQQIDNSYSFSNGEWARGFIKFKNGFDVPLNGTVYVGVNQRTGGNINLNNGTLVLTSDLHLGYNSKIIGNGFIKTNNYNCYSAGTIRFIGNIYIDDNFTLNGLNNSTFETTTADFIYLNKIQNVSFKKIRIVTDEPSSFIFPASWLNSLILEDVDWEIASGKNIVLTASTVSILGKSNLLCPRGTFKIPTTITCSQNGSLSIDYLTTVETKGLILELSSAQLALGFNTRLNFTQSTTWAGLGYCRVDGKATLSASGKKIYTNNTGGIAMTAGSKLLLDNIQLVIT